MSLHPSPLLASVLRRRTWCIVPSVSSHCAHNWHSSMLMSQWCPLDFILNEVREVPILACSKSYAKPMYAFGKQKYSTPHQADERSPCWPTCVSLLCFLFLVFPFFLLSFLPQPVITYIFSRPIWGDLQKWRIFARVLVGRVSCCCLLRPARISLISL